MGDFRDQAVTASQTLLSAHPSIDPTQSNVSYCIRAAEDTDQSARTARIVGVIAVILGLGGIVVGGIVAMVGKFRGFATESDENHALLMTARFSGGGFVILFGYLYAIRRRTRSRVLARLGGALPTDCVTHSVSIENAETRHVPKFVTEDHAIVILRPESHCAQIEGFRYRYLIQANDVQSIGLHGGDQHTSASVHVTYQIGNTTLALALTPDQVSKQIGYQLGGKLPALYDQLRACLAAP